MWHMNSGKERIPESYNLSYISLHKKKFLPKKLAFFVFWYLSKYVQKLKKGFGQNFFLIIKNMTNYSFLESSLCHYSYATYLDGFFAN